MRVLVVDDEPIMRNAYSSLIDWEKNGFSLVGSAHNGKVALEFMRGTSVDIVITDLKMPVMSGLELIRNASAEFPQTKFIVMSGFDEFHMVKEAYTLGVKEYFLKIELDPQDILQTLFKLKEEIEQERIRDSVVPNIQNESERRAENRNINANQYSHTVYCEKLLKNLIWGADAQATENQLEEYGIHIWEKELSLMVLAFPDYYIAEEKLWEGEREIFKYAILNVLEEICQKYDDLYVFCNLPDEFVVVGNIVDRQSKKLEKFFDEARSAIRTCFGIDMDCGLGSVANKYGDLKVIYREARQACLYSFVIGHGKFIVYKDIQYIGGNVDFTKRAQDLKNLIMMSEPEKIRNGAFEFRISPNAVNFNQVDKLKNLFHSYYIVMLNFVEENDLQSDIAKTIFSYDTIIDGADLDQMNDWLIKSIFDIVDALVYKKGIYKAINYIKNHYNEQISLSTLAELLEVSEGHLSRMFQNKVGMSFTQYLLKVRMDMAVHLLQNENLKIYEVAMRVGYPNAEQFSRMFKKVIGKTPKEFQK